MKIGKSFLAAAAAVALSTGLATAAEKITMALPGVPPVFLSSVALVAQEAGLFKKHGVDVTLKPMNSGAAAAKAVVAGNLDLAFSPTQFVVSLASNAGAPVKLIYGLDNPDWVLASMDPKMQGCDALKKGAVGVDSKGGARWIQLNTILARKCKLKIDADVKTVPLSSNVGTAMAAGQIPFGILHLDDIPSIEKKSGKKVHVFETVETIAPNIHQISLIALKSTIEKRKDTLTRVVAALRDAADMINNPANLDKVSGMVGMTKRTPEEAKAAIPQLVAITFWPKGTAGLDKKRVEGAIANQVRVGKFSKGRSGINPAKTPVTYDQITDLSVWEAAQKMK
ncbi:MAG: ABC transporter substrate-binding protein [Beijerinckiaceae bacterium]